MSDLLRKWMKQDIGVTVPINNFEKVGRYIHYSNVLCISFSLTLVIYLKWFTEMSCVLLSNQYEIWKLIIAGRTLQMVMLLGSYFINAIFNQTSNNLLMHPVLMLCSRTSPDFNRLLRSSACHWIAGLSMPFKRDRKVSLAASSTQSKSLLTVWKRNCVHQFQCRRQACGEHRH